MSELENVTQDELTILKERATKLGISFRANIGIDSLKEKIAAAMSDTPEETKEETIATPADNKGDVPVESKMAMQARLRKEANKLIRVRITCMNQNKKDWEGEMFTVSNSLVGTLKRYVPFDNSEGWHVPQMMLNMIKERKFQSFSTKKVNGVKIREGKVVPEFSVEIMEPLNKEDLNKLADRQAQANSID